MRKQSSWPVIPGLAKNNIDKVLQIEQQLLRQRTHRDRLSEAISRVAGSLTFVSAHVVAVAGWIALNSGVASGFPIVDPFPFNFLAMAVSLEVLFLSTFVLMSQNRQRQQADHWAHLDLQLSLLAEQEATKTLQMLQSICDRLGLKGMAGDAELQEMIGTTHLDVLAMELAQGLEKTRGQDSLQGNLSAKGADGNAAPRAGNQEKE